MDDDPFVKQRSRDAAKRVQVARSAWLAGPRIFATSERQDGADAQVHAAALVEMLIKKGLINSADFLEALADVYERSAREGL